MMAQGSWTIPGTGGSYVMQEGVRCEGEHRGGRCDKLLIEVLEGSAKIKCSRCGLVLTYRRKAVDE